MMRRKEKGLLKSVALFCGSPCRTYLERQARSDTDISAGKRNFIFYERCVVTRDFIRKVSTVGSDREYGSIAQLYAV
jgi:hypothetical protein